MSFPQYPKYRDSGVEWLGEVPYDWEIQPLMRLTPDDRQIMYGIVLPGPHVTDGVPIVKGGDVAPERLNPDTLSRTTHEIESGYVRSRLRGGDLVYAIRGSIGEAAIVPESLAGANLTQDAARIAPRPGIDVQWLLFTMRSDRVFAQLEQTVNGATIRGINIYQLKRARIPCPTAGEQALIASFLNRETTKIDELVEEQRRLIELLKEKRQALISHAVTQGLNPQAPMKPSGIEWLGDIPEHWRLMTLSRLSNDGTQNGLYKPPSEHQSHGTPCISMGEAFSGRAIHETAKDRVVLSDDEFKKYCLSEGDLLFARRSLVFEGSGKCSIVGCGAVGQVFESSIIRVRLNKTYLLPEFALFFFSCIQGRYQMLSITEQTTISGINSQKLKQSLIPVPPIEEQQHLYEMALGIEGRYEALIAEANHGIGLLQERRTALISAAVTGKIDVRGLAEPVTA